MAHALRPASKVYGRLGRLGRRTLHNPGIAAAECRRFPPKAVSHAASPYYRFTLLSVRDIEDLLTGRGIVVSYQSIRRRCLKFGPGLRRSFKRREGRLGDRWHADEVFVAINGHVHYLWRAVNQDGDGLDILVQRRRDLGIELNRSCHCMLESAIHSDLAVV